MKILEEIMSILVSSSFGLDFWRLFDFSNSFLTLKGIKINNLVLKLKFESDCLLENKQKINNLVLKLKFESLKLNCHDMVCFKIFSFSTKFKFIEKKACLFTKNIISLRYFHPVVKN